MEKQIAQIREFHTTYGQPVLDTPTIPTKERCMLRVDLLSEEVREFNEAIAENDIVGVADALTDIAYVLLGAVHEFGLGEIFEKCFDEVHSSNMSKLDENGKPIYREDGKVLKGPNYFKPNLQKILTEVNE